MFFSSPWIYRRKTPKNTSMCIHQDTTCLVRFLKDCRLHSILLAYDTIKRNYPNVRLLEVQNGTSSVQSESFLLEEYLNDTLYEFITIRDYNYPRIYQLNPQNLTTHDPNLSIIFNYRNKLLGIKQIVSIIELEESLVHTLEERADCYELQHNNCNVLL